MKALFVLPLLLASQAALADDGAVLHCRSLSEAGARLVCYDAIPVARAATPAPTSTPEQRFGMEAAKHAEPEAPKFIESTIPGKFEGWGPNSEFKLANGQVWRVVDGSSADMAPPMQDPHVKIVRNIIGTLFLEIDGTNNSPKVRRVR